ncbi:class I mannose-6-phosphate isomerase [Congregicoccus parvus]|uniref:class I mannose-6-phosphate isomerase n=1 Tax=Congregicoccus parvus TaxID=3081749 RepID=UPI003FA56A33
MSNSTAMHPLAHRGLPLRLPPNRVWRTYPGGATLDRLEGIAAPRDGAFPEDWIGSVTAAVAPGREVPGEGLAHVTIGGESMPLHELFASDPLYFFGSAHLAAFGAQPKILVKLLDSAIRLHVQAHPPRAFARARLGVDAGKTEAYHVLAVRDDVREPYVFLGFQHPPSPDRLREIVRTQDIAALEACFDRYPVKPGDTLLVPAGVPHALGEGVFLIELQEPSDLVVRLEYQRGGYTLPEAARFMGRDIDFALEFMDLRPHPHAELDRTARCLPRDPMHLAPGCRREILIGPEQTPCFRMLRTSLESPVELHDRAFHIAIVTRGRCRVSGEHGTLLLEPFDRLLVPAGLGPLAFDPLTATEIIECHPPLPH